MSRTDQAIAERTEEKPASSTLAAAVADLDHAREDFDRARLALEQAQAKHDDVVDRAKTPMQLLLELRSLLPLTVVEYQIFQRYNKEQANERTQAIATKVDELRRAIERVS